MNNNGNSNFIFIILIPLFFIISLVILDTFISYSENKRYKQVTENIISEVMNNNELYTDEYYLEIKRLYEFNNFETDLLVVEADDNSVRVNNEHSYFGLFSSLTNKKGKSTIIKILGVEFKAKKSSKTIINVEARYNSEDEIEFNYIEE